MRAGRDRVHHSSIGRFAGLTDNSANAVEQLDVGIPIRLLRDLDVPLEEVKALMVPGSVREFYLVDERDTGDPQRYLTEITWPVQRRTTSLD